MKKKLFILFITAVIQIISKEQMVKQRVLGDPNFGTHLTPLITAALYTQGPVLEMGSGDYSTPLLHAICSVDKRLLISADTDKKWLSFFTDLETSWHQFVYVPVYEDDWSQNPKPFMWDAIGNNIRWGVVFIDHRPGERRAIDIKRFKNQADIIVVHDTQQPSYGYEPVFAEFKYRYTYERYATTTTLVSNSIDVASLF